MTDEDISLFWGHGEHFADRMVNNEISLLKIRLEEEPLNIVLQAFYNRLIQIGSRNIEY